MEQSIVEGYSAFIIYTLAVLGLVAAMLILSHILGQQRHTKATLEPYESGIVSVGSARLRLSVDYYLVAILFVIFDLEAVFLYSWAIAFEESGWQGFIEALVFIVVLAVALFYLWKMKALHWGPPSQRYRHEHSGKNEFSQSVINQHNAVNIADTNDALNNKKISN